MIINYLTKKIKYVLMGKDALINIMKVRSLIRHFNYLFIFLLLIPLLTTMTSFHGSIEVNRHSELWLTYKHDNARTGFYQGNWSWNYRVYVEFYAEPLFMADLCIHSNPLIYYSSNGSILITFASCDGYQYTIDNNGNLVWKYRTGGGMVEGLVIYNGSRPIVVVGGGSGSLYAFDGDDGELIWSIKAYYFQRAVPLLFDTGNRKYIVANQLNGTLSFITIDGRVAYNLVVGTASVSAPVSGDVYGNGEQVIVVAEANMPYIHVIRFANNVPSVITIKLDDNVPSSFESQAFPILYDVDKDGADDIIIATYSKLLAISVRKNIVLWSSDVDGVCYTSPSIGDVDGDYLPDIVLTTTQGLYVYDLEGGLKIGITGLNAGFSSPIISDVDGDGLNEVIIGRYNGEINILTINDYTDLYDMIEFTYKTGAPVMSSASIGDIDGDNLPEILIGSRDLYLYIIRGILSDYTITPRTPSITETTLSTEENLTTQTSIMEISTPVSSELESYSGTSITIFTGPGKEYYKPDILLITVFAVVGAVIVIMVYIITRD